MRRIFTVFMLLAGVMAGVIGFSTSDVDEAVIEPLPVLPVVTSAPPTTSSPPPVLTVPVVLATTTTTTLPPFSGWVDPLSIGQPWGNTVSGVLTFRGSPTRRWHGEGPVPQEPERAWRFPAGQAMCSTSSVFGVDEQWCGMGWTGQPAIFERGEITWLVFGAYDAKVHFLNAETGERLLPDFVTGDIIKGSVTVDPDGFPLVYTGSRDNYLRVLGIEGDEAVELWRLHAYDVSPTKWNNDWDSAPLVIDDYLFAGGENSRFHIIKLNRGYDDLGQVTVEPELLWDFAGWDEQLLSAVGSNVSIEMSPLILGDVLYFANSGGLVQGWNIGGLKDGVEPHRVFRFWAGDDVDASIVPDDEGFLYVGGEYERSTERSKEVGQIIKLDPGNPDDPVVWSVHDRPYVNSGVWATPAIYEDLVIVPTDQGLVHGIDRATGEIRWSLDLPGPTWSSPTIVDGVMVMGDCSGRVRAFDVSDTSVSPPELWQVTTGACVESSVTVWKGSVYSGSRDGFLYAWRDLVLADEPG